MSTQEANECKTRVDASTQALRTYYQQEGASLYNLNEALDALVTLTDISKKTVHSEQQKRFLELSNKPILALYMGFPDQLIPAEIENQRLQPFLPPRERSQSRPTQGGREIRKSILDNFKRKIRMQLFFSDPNQGSKTESIPSGGPFEHGSFKLKSTFYPVGPFQLESMFHSIEQDLHRQKYKEPKKKNLTKEEYKAIKSLKNNKGIIIKPADKGSAIVILDKESYINEGQRQLNDTKLYEKTNSKHTGVYITCYKEVKSHKTPATT